MTRSRRAALAATLIATAVLALLVLTQLWRAGSSQWREAVAAEWLAVGTDSIALAKAAIESCSKIVGDKIPCYEKHLIPLVDIGGPKLAMGTLMQVANGDRDVRGFGHVYAHAIGMHAFDAD